LIGLARQDGLQAATLADRSAIEACVTRARAYWRVAAPHLENATVELEEDREHACFRVVVLVPTNGASQRNVIDHETCTSPEFEEIRRLLSDLNAAGDPPFEVRSGERAERMPNLQTAIDGIVANARKGLEIQRYKGLGEMNPSQLWETTMDPDQRTLLQVKVDDAVEADIIFSTLMGDEVEPRRKFIEDNALSVRNLDI
jgi:DNA gyrase subunit B